MIFDETSKNTTMSIIIIMAAAKRQREENARKELSLQAEHCHFCGRNLVFDSYLVSDNGYSVRTCMVCFRNMLIKYGNPRKSRAYGTTFYWWPIADRKTIVVSKRDSGPLDLGDEWEASAVELSSP